MSYELNFPIPYIPLPDRSGANGLGQLWIGNPNSDPKTNVVDRVSVYVVRQNNTPLAIGQPIELSAGGVPLYNGSPVQLEVGGSYCMQVVDRLGALIYYAPYAGKLGEEIGGIVIDIASLETIISQIQYGISNFAALGTTPSIGAGQIVNLKQHTSGNIGGGQFVSVSGSVANDGGTQINSATSGLYWKRINYSNMHVSFFGCKPVAGFNNYSALVLAMAAASNITTGSVILEFDVGQYEVATVLPTQHLPLMLSGKGAGDASSYTSPLTKGTTLRYTGPNVAANFLIYFEMTYGGGGIKNIAFEFANNCDGFELDSCSGLDFENIIFANDVYVGLGLTSTTTNTCSWNTFKNIKVDNFYSGAGLCCIRLFGDPTFNFNACHNTFENTRLATNGNRHGVVCGFADNNSFWMTYHFLAPGSTGYTAYGDSVGPGGPSGNNIFFHFQGSVYNDPTMPGPCCVVYGYQRDNGEPPPAGSNTDKMFYMEDNGSIRGIERLGFKNNVADTNPKILNYYEKSGSFTPVVFGATAAGTCTYNVQEGKYTRIGDLCFVRISVAWTGHTGTGDLRISGTPFTAGGGVNSLSVGSYNNLLVGAAGKQLTSAMINGTVRFFVCDVAGGAQTNLQMDAVAEVYVTGVYIVS